MKYGRSYNFSADAAPLPEEVLEELAAEVMNYHGSGLSVLELADDADDAGQLFRQTEAALRKLVRLPAGTAVRFLRDDAAVSALPGARDLSADFLSGPLALEEGEAVYARTRRSLGVDGLTVALVPAGALAEDLPRPTCWAVYCLGKVLNRLNKLGGLDAAGAASREKAGLLRDFLAKSRLFSKVGEERPLHTVSFTAPTAAQNDAVLAAARGAHLLNLEGPGCLRAALSVNLPREGAEALTDFLRKFEAAAK